MTSLSKIYYSVVFHYTIFHRRLLLHIYFDSFAEKYFTYLNLSHTFLTHISQFLKIKNQFTYAVQSIPISIFFFCGRNIARYIFSSFLTILLKFVIFAGNKLPQGGMTDINCNKRTTNTENEGYIFNVSFLTCIASGDIFE